MATAAPVSNETSNTQGRLSDPYLWHRLHSLSGIFPIGVFLLQHLIANSYALRGAVAYNTVVKVFGYLPFVAVLEVVVIYLPILYHSIYGFYITAYAQPNVGRYGYGRNWMYLMQRISGVVAFFYIGFHIWNTSLAKYIQQWHGNPHPEDAISYAAMSGQLANPWYFAAYAIGITATCSTSPTAYGTFASAGASPSRPAAAAQLLRLLGTVRRLHADRPGDHHPPALRRFPRASTVTLPPP